MKNILVALSFLFTSTICLAPAGHRPRVTSEHSVNSG